MHKLEKSIKVYNKLRGKLVECLEKKRNYTQLMIGSGKTGKSKLLLNKHILENYGSPQLTNETRMYTVIIFNHNLLISKFFHVFRTKKKGDKHAGIIQRALSDICTYLKMKGEEDKEVMISIVGFHEDRVIDLLNLD